MVSGRTSCVHRGNTFYGIVSVLGEGPRAEVLVRYNGTELRSRAGAQGVEGLAQALLRERVVLEAIGAVVTEATHRGGPSPHGSDGRERRAPRAA